MTRIFGYCGSGLAVAAALAAVLASPAVAQTTGQGVKSPAMLAAKGTLSGCLLSQAGQGAYFPADSGRSALALLRACPDAAAAYGQACAGAGVEPGLCLLQAAVVSEHALDTR